MQGRLVAADGVLQARPFAVGEQIEVSLADRQRDGAAGRALGQRLQLQAEAFLERARGHAGRVERLHELAARP